MHTVIAISITLKVELRQLRSIIQRRSFICITFAKFITAYYNYYDLYTINQYKASISFFSREISKISRFSSLNAVRL